MHINKVILSGHVGKIGVMRYLDDGKAVIDVRLATTEQWKRREGEGRVDHTEWHNLTFQAEKAETIGRFLDVGQELYVEGKQRTREYDGENGRKVITYIAVEAFQFGSRPKQKAEAQQADTPEIQSHQRPSGASAMRPQQTPNNPVQSPRSRASARPSQGPSERVLADDAHQPVMSPAHQKPYPWVEARRRREAQAASAGAEASRHDASASSDNDGEASPAPQQQLPARTGRVPRGIGRLPR